MRGYYTGRLDGVRLCRVYDVAPPRVRQYLDAEIAHVLSRLPCPGLVLELGCGYGRVAARLAARPRPVVGIDTSLDNLRLARTLLTAAEATAAGPARLRYLVMNAVALAFPDAAFDAVVCVQNGICAFSVDERQLLREAMRVTRPGGRILFSSYADAFWPYRLEWFERQAAEALVGEIDYDRTRDGVIACRDGFRAGTMRAGDFRRLCAEIDVRPSIEEVDGSSIFCEIQQPPARDAR